MARFFASQVVDFSSLTFTRNLRHRITSYLAEEGRALRLFDAKRLIFFFFDTCATLPQYHIFPPASRKALDGGLILGTWLVSEWDEMVLWDGPGIGKCVLSFGVV